MVSSIQLMQIFVYGKAKGDGKSPLVMWPIFLIVGEWIFVMTTFGLEVGGVRLNENIQFLRAAGYCKALITFVKYMPQVYLNYKRKSTEGWSIVNILLDLTGGSFSVLQDVIKAVGHGKSPFSGGGFNIVKWMLGIMSIFFDCIFLFQHYVLYRHATPRP
jgi:cystinosin